jgi:hypothetical protein
MTSSRIWGNKTPNQVKQFRDKALLVWNDISMTQSKYDDTAQQVQVLKTRQNQLSRHITQQKELYDNLVKEMLEIK